MVYYASITRNNIQMIRELHFSTYQIFVICHLYDLLWLNYSEI